MKSKEVVAEQVAFLQNDVDERRARFILSMIDTGEYIDQEVINYLKKYMK